MNVPAIAEGIQLSQQALLDLERSKVSPVELLDNVSQILGVKYGNIRSRFFDPPQGDKIIPQKTHSSPKEEWVLRWLLKRLGLSTLGGKVKISKEDSLRMRLDNRSWLLLLHLVYHVPCHALARILLESNFVTNLDACFRDGEQTTGLLQTESDAQDSSTPSSESKRKKRKRDEDGIELRQQMQGRSPNRPLPVLLATSICATVRYCVELSGTNADKASSEHIRLALAASPSTAASVTGRLLSSFTAVILQAPSASLNGSSLSEFAPGLLGLWEFRTAEDASISEGESDREFTVHCLSPCLAFLNVLKTSDLTTEYRHIVKKIERLIALHSILPIRAKFFAAQKPNGVVDDGVQRSMIDSLPISESMAPLLLDIAVRTVPRSTVRRRQYEQPWLEALSSQLVASCGDHGLQELLEVALARKITLPANELSQIALRQFSSANIRWPLLVQILRIDPSLFFSDSVPLLETLCDRIVDSGEDEYSLIRDSVVIPLMKAAAQNRELQTYVHVWHRKLSEYVHKDSSSLQRRGSRIWQDPNVFAAFTEITTTYAPPSFVQHLLYDLLEKMKKINTEEDMFAVLAWTAISSSVIPARAKDLTSEEDLLQQLLEVAATAYTSTLCPNAQAWRFLRLFRQILTVLPDGDYAERLLSMSISHTSYPSLGDSKMMEEPSVAIEWFHILVSQAVARPAKFQELLRVKLKHLADFLQNLCDQSVDISLSGLADACLGIILQNPEVLLITPTENLWPALWQYATTSGFPTGQRLFEALVTSETVASNHVLLLQCFQAVHESIMGKGAHRSRFAYKILLSMPRQNIKRSQEHTKLLRLLENAGAAKVAENESTMVSVQLENVLFREFKSRAAVPSTTNRQSCRLPILEADSFERLCLELDLLKLTLKAPNQFVVDDLLSTLTSLTSPEAPKFDSMPENGPAAIYQRLCSLTSFLLARFRKRLGGRHHLLLPMVQGLLRCLFRPIPIPASSKQPQIRQHQPPWLLDATSQFLDAKSAIHFTRLLTSLCDPTASSVKHSRRASAGLTDETKRAKSISGQYMQYLVMEYARCQLQGQLPPEVKAALMPGLYAVLDVMSRELMRGMNAAMDSSSRAIFKRLYEDYQRFGRWNQN